MGIAERFVRNFTILTTIKSTYIMTPLAKVLRGRHTLSEYTGRLLKEVHDGKAGVETFLHQPAMASRD
jgi:hypothetical protein